MPRIRPKHGRTDTCKAEVVARQGRQAFAAPKIIGTRCDQLQAAHDGWAHTFNHMIAMSQLCNGCRQVQQGRQGPAVSPICNSRAAEEINGVAWHQQSMAWLVKSATVHTKLDFADGKAGRPMHQSDHWWGQPCFVARVHMGLHTTSCSLLCKSGACRGSPGRWAASWARLQEHAQWTLR